MHLNARKHKKYAPSGVEPREWTRRIGGEWVWSSARTILP